MAAPLFTPTGGYGTQSGGYSYVQTSPGGGQWSTVPATPARTVGVTSPTQVLGPQNYAPPSSGQTLGASSGGGGGSYQQQWEAAGHPGTAPVGYHGESAAPSGPSAEELARQRYEAEQRAAIESGYSTYEAQLDAMLNEGLPGQQAGLETQAEAQLAKGEAGLLSQREEGLGLLGRERERTETSQVRNLKDLASNLRSSFMAGNVFLGARGAGDSSAANQYSYALTKLGSQQRGDIMRQTSDIMNEIGDRESRLQNVYTTSLNDIQTDHDAKIGQISQWFYEQQNALRGQKGQLAVSKGQDLASLSQNMLNIAIQEMNFAKTEAANKQSMLEQWALNNNRSIQEAKALISEQAQFNPALPQAQSIAGAPQVSGGNINVRAAYGGGGGYNQDEERNRLFGGGASRGYGASGSW